jgi:hypothetical protein
VAPRWWPGTLALLRQAAAHGRYHVRRFALSTLVKRAEAQDRVSLAIAANDRSAEVRLTWAQLMADYRWPQALDSLVRLLRDKRDFNRDFIARTFDLPVPKHTSNAKSFRLPERGEVITGRSHSRVREETASPDDGL